MKEDVLGRRDFLKTTAAGLLVLFSEKELRAAMQEEAVKGPPVKFGVVGLGQWGKEILASLSRLPSAQVTAICDTYQPYLKKGQEVAPKAAPHTDYRKLLEAPEVEAVVIATPSHLHKDIALAAIQAGKHVYCEAPLATTVDDAKAIAMAAQGSKQVFQAGLQGRSNAMYRHIGNFVKTGVLGTPAQVQAQANKKQSWRRAAPTPEREAEMNWRLSSKTSNGLVGEVGIHHLDLVNWYLKGLPTAVTGFGAIVNWNDGRDVADTVQCVFEYPKKVHAIFSSTLASSFSDAYTLFQGSNSSLMLRERRGWMVKEADSPLLGWEVYARKEPVHNETGIAMVADATKLIAAGKEPGKEGSTETTQEALYLALEDFTRSIREGGKPAAGPLEGYQATVLAIKANEAVTSGSKIAYQQAWFELK
ncbi:MAG TPA: Gfo/Idh/MocA family oxidoreductase [Blastocatellia bacterium]|nr:Gfo/Idh/MocA family oxidoreductase [Blastocatellia bacterium]